MRRSAIATREGKQELWVSHMKNDDDEIRTAQAAMLADLLSRRRLVDPFADVPLIDIRRSFEGLHEPYPPVLNLAQAAKLANVTPATLKRKVSEGSFPKSVKRGKPLLFWRDLFVKELLK